MCKSVGRLCIVDTFLIQRRRFRAISTIGWLVKAFVPFFMDVSSKSRANLASSAAESLRNSSSSSSMMLLLSS